MADSSASTMIFNHSISCGTVHVPWYSSFARLVLGVTMIGVPAAVGLWAGMHSLWGEPLAYLVPWALMAIAICWAPVGLRPPRDPIAAIVDDVRLGRMELEDGLRLIGVIHDRRRTAR